MTCRQRELHHDESGGFALAWNVKEDARGLYQIRKTVLVDYNKRHHTALTMNDLWNPDTNYKVAIWYTSVRIPQMLRHFHLPVTTENLIIAYNAGINNARKHRIPKTTKDYLRKYYKLVKKEGR